MRRKSLLLTLLAVILVAGSGIAENLAGTRIRGHSVRGGRSSHHGHGHYRRPFRSHGHRTHIGIHYTGYYGHYHYPGAAYYPYSYAWYPAPSYAAVYSSSPIAYLDTDVKPEEAAIFIDGDYVGIADSFDGFPRYLSIEPGRHTIRLEADGFKTWTRTIRIPTGGITKLRIEMTRGEGIDAGEPVDSYEGEPAAEDPVDRRGEPEDLVIDRGDGEPGPGFVRLSVSPAEAAVYLDGEFYAPAATLERLHGDLRLESGIHVIEVVMPGYETSTRRIELAPGDRLSLSIELRKEER